MFTGFRDVNRLAAVNRFPVRMPEFRGLWTPLDTIKTAKTAFGIPGKAAKCAVTQNICPCSVIEL
jgi:hypothetical protein